MKVKIILVKCTHETKYGIDSYVETVKKHQTIEEVIERIQNECDYNEDDADNDEYFNSDIEEIIIDTDDYEIVD